MSSEENQIKNEIIAKEEKTKEKNNKSDSFDKIFNIQKLIHKQAGLKELCKKKIIKFFIFYYIIL